MLSRDQLCRLCASQPQAIHVAQWGGADVYKVGGKLLAVEGPGGVTVVFKATDLGFEILSDTPGLRPALYMAARGLKGIQDTGEPGLSEDCLKVHILASYNMAVAALTHRKWAAQRL